jgi:hypothetical protein
MEGRNVPGLWMKEFILHCYPELENNKDEVIECLCTMDFWDNDKAKAFKAGWDAYHKLECAKESKSTFVHILDDPE